LGAINNNGLALGSSPLNISFASVGTGLTGAELKTYSNLVIQLQNSLGRGLLLDIYPNAASAYSLRKLRVAYTGSAVRIRRSSDNTEQDIRFSSNGELDTNSLLSFCGNSDGFVTTWYDQSGNVNNATQTTTSKQPQIVSGGGLILQNGKVSIQSISTQTDLSTPQRFSANPMYIFMNYQRGTTGGNAGPIGQWDTQTDWTIVTAGSYLGVNIDTAGTRTDLNIGLNFATNSNNLLSIVYDGKMSLYSNGILRGESSVILNTRNGGSFSLFNYQKNSGLSDLNSKIQEVIIYTTTQSTNRSSIESMINTYYQLY
jgi:hypothetical protein